jgi:hypothetical protein
MEPPPMIRAALAILAFLAALAAGIYLTPADYLP